MRQSTGNFASIRDLLHNNKVNVPSFRMKLLVKFNLELVQKIPGATYDAVQAIPNRAIRSLTTHAMGDSEPPPSAGIKGKTNVNNP